MSKKELDKLQIIQAVLTKQITQKNAAKILGLKSDRQVRNLLVRYKKFGVHGLTSKLRGKKSNRSYSTEFKDKILNLIRENYPDFGPTFASEKLSNIHNLKISDETLRKWMIEADLWRSRRKKICIHPLRSRREFFGELIQIDGSFHPWFEDRADKCVLIVFIDDATSKITSLYFCKTECLQGYLEALKKHITTYGRPISLYSDRHAIFGGSDRMHHAQFVRALEELGINSILACSPQAKGRVERANQTLQDRLVKELRLRNISSSEEANKYLPEFIKEFNNRFSKEPRGQFDAHRPLDSGYDLERILTRCEIRTLSKDLSFSFYNTTYQIIEPAIVNRLVNKKIEIRQRSDGKEFKVFYGDQELRYKPLCERVSHNIIDAKEKLIWKQGRGNHHHSNAHPWKKYGYQLRSPGQYNKGWYRGM